MATTSVRHSGRGVPRPPGPRMSVLALLRARRRDPLSLVADIAAAHPRVAYTRLLTEQVYVVSDPALVREVLVTQGRHYRKGRGLEKAKELLGDGLLTSEGETHRRNRRLAQPAFHRERVARYAEDMVAAAQAHAEGWRDGRQIDVAADMASLTLDVVGRALFRADLQDDAAGVRRALTDFLGAFDRILSPLGALLLRLPTPTRRRLDRARGRLDEVVFRLIRDHRADPDAFEGDLLSMLLQARDDDSGPAFTDTQLRDEVLTLVLAGHETTANALAWAWYLLDRDPAARTALHEELDLVLRRRAPTVADLPALPVTTATFAEALRLYPPAYVLGRRATRDLELDGWPVPAGSLVLVSEWLAHRDTRWWGRDAAAFRPGRWLTPDGRFDENAPGQPRGAWFPFGAGSRVCIGESFAWTEGVLLLATLASHWEVRVAPGLRVEPDPAVTLRPRAPVRAVLQRRTR